MLEKRLLLFSQEIALEDRMDFAVSNGTMVVMVVVICSVNTKAHSSVLSAHAC